MKRHCIFPFERIQIELDGDVTFCCTAFNKNYSIGNIFTDEIDDIWYGKKAKEFRKSILDGSYKYCNLNICGNYYDEYFGKLNYNEDTLSPPYPNFVYLSYMPSCNVKCKICRDNIRLETKEETEHFNSIADKIILLCKNAEIIYLNGGGELFTSPHCKQIIKRLKDTYPKIRFFIHTNGLLCDEAHIKEYGLDGKVDIFNISIHAATKKTYESIVRGGHWEQLQKNLKYLSSQKCKLFLPFVINSLNYKEMPAFVKMAHKLNATPLFWMLRDKGYSHSHSQMCKELDKYTCWKASHPDYNDFLKVLNKLKRMKKYKYSLIEESLRVLQSQTTDPWWVRFTKFFNF
ncbi:radical SAM protein [bacterium]|nr:radical SAM protein [bacterium]